METIGQMLENSEREHGPKAVREFLTEHESVLAARVKREVRNKLTTGLKNPRQRSGENSDEILGGQ